MLILKQTCCRECGSDTLRNIRKKDKLIKKLQSNPRDFTFDEMETLLGYFNYRRSNKGKTSGSRVMFISEGKKAIIMHKPHPRKELLEYQIKDLLKTLKEEGLL